MIISKIKSAFQLLNWKALSVRRGICPACGPSLIIKLDNNEISVRCMRCGASVIHMSIISVLNNLFKDYNGKTVYELSSRGPLYDYLKKHVKRLVSSEYYEEISPGQCRNGILCQNIEKLTFSDACFDLCTSTEVFEHVANDLAGFSEIYRVLRSEGLFVFTVPLNISATTVERAVRSNDTIKYLLPPEYHGDRIRGQNQVLVFRDYGIDIVERLKSQGFTTVEIFRPELQIYWPFVRPVIVAGKA